MVSRGCSIEDEFFKSHIHFSKYLHNKQSPVHSDLAVGLTPVFFLRTETGGGGLLHHDVHPDDGGLHGQFHDNGHSSRAECGIRSNTSHDRVFCVYDGESELRFSEK